MMKAENSIFGSVNQGKARSRSPTSSEKKSSEVPRASPNLFRNAVRRIDTSEPAVAAGRGEEDDDDDDWVRNNLQKKTWRDKNTHMSPSSRPSWGSMRSGVRSGERSSGRSRGSHDGDSRSMGSRSVGSKSSGGEIRRTAHGKPNIFSMLSGANHPHSPSRGSPASSRFSRDKPHSPARTSPAARLRNGQDGSPARGSPASSSGRAPPPSIFASALKGTGVSMSIRPMKSSERQAKSITKEKIMTKVDDTQGKDGSPLDKPRFVLKPNPDYDPEAAKREVEAEKRTGAVNALKSSKQTPKEPPPSPQPTAKERKKQLEEERRKQKEAFKAKVEKMKPLEKLGLILSDLAHRHKPKDSESFGEEIVRPAHGDCTFSDVCAYNSGGWMLEFMGTNGIRRIHLNGPEGREAFIDACLMRKEGRDVCVRCFVGPYGEWDGQPAVSLEVVAAEVSFFNNISSLPANAQKPSSDLDEGGLSEAHRKTPKIYMVHLLETERAGENRILTRDLVDRLQGAVVRMAVSRSVRSSDAESTFEHRPDIKGYFKSEVDLNQSLFFGAPGIMSWGLQDPKTDSPKGFLWKLSNDSHFRNSASAPLLRKRYGLNGGTFGVGPKNISAVFDIPQSEIGKTAKMTDMQSQKWADIRVTEGVAKQKEKAKTQQEKRDNAEEAIVFYDAALELVPDHQNGLVAKGAAKCILRDFVEAAKCLRAAINVDPTSNAAENARKYLQKCEDHSGKDFTKEAIQKRLEVMRSKLDSDKSKSDRRRSRSRSRTPDSNKDISDRDRQRSARSRDSDRRDDRRGGERRGGREDRVRDDRDRGRWDSRSPSRSRSRSRSRNRDKDRDRSREEKRRSPERKFVLRPAKNDDDGEDYTKKAPPSPEAVAAATRAIASLPTQVTGSSGMVIDVRDDLLRSRTVAGSTKSGPTLPPKQNISQVQMQALQQKAALENKRKRKEEKKRKKKEKKAKKDKKSKKSKKHKKDKKKKDKKKRKAASSSSDSSDDDVSISDGDSVYVV